MSKALLTAVAVASAFAWSSSFAGPEGGVPSSADETTASMSTLRSLDRFTGGYKGWGPMGLPIVPSQIDEAMPAQLAENQEEGRKQLAEIEQVRERVWVANAPLRAPYELENIGATKAAAAQAEYRFDSTMPQ